MTEAEKQKILAEQAPRLAEAKERVAAGPPSPGMIERIIAKLRSMGGGQSQATAKPGPPPQRYVEDVAGGIAARQRALAAAEALRTEK